MAITKSDLATALGTNEKTLDAMVAQAAIQAQETLIEKLIAQRDASNKVANDAIATEQVKLAEMRDALKK